MGAYRVVYIFALAGAASFYALYPYWFSGYLFFVLLLMLPFDLLAGLPGMLTRRAALTAPEMLEQGAHGVLSITTLQNHRYPAKYVKAYLRESYNGYIQKRRYLCGAAGGDRRDIALDTTHSGVMVYELKKIRTVSLIGLFSLPSKMRGKVTVLILPLPVRPSRVTALPRGVVNRPKPGGGFSEDYDMREYLPGDQIRSIHWKLSAKTDQLVVREPLVPPPHSRLVETEWWRDANERDLILGRLRWVSDYLLKWEMPFYVKCGPNGPMTEITHEREMTQYIFHMLTGSVQSVQAPVSPPAQFTWVFKIDAKPAPTPGAENGDERIWE